jgi:hypothetical protein
MTILTVWKDEWRGVREDDRHVRWSLGVTGDHIGYFCFQKLHSQVTHHGWFHDNEQPWFELVYGTPKHPIGARLELHDPWNRARSTNTHNARNNCKNRYARRGRT